MSGKILVIGDSMLDVYWQGTVGRVSPEAPVPILSVDNIDYRAGGAANVALSIAALGSKVELLSLIGEDANGTTLFDLLKPSVETRGSWLLRGRQTTTKYRTVAGNHQISRSDFDVLADESLAFELGERALYQLTNEKYELVVLSDYNKGALARSQAIIDFCNMLGIKTLVDPKCTAWSKRYNNATLIKPNEQEYAAWLASSDYSSSMLYGPSKYVLVTQGGNGMTLKQNADPFPETHFPAATRQVADVTGAGDTVIAALAHFLAQGSELKHAVHWANEAAGVAVQRFGTYQVKIEDLQPWIA